VEPRAPLRPPPKAPDGSPEPRRGEAGFENDVRAMFTHIAPGYERFDHMASLGQDYLWRPRALWSLERRRSGRETRAILDIGCGTGELARLARRRFPQAAVTGLDLTRAMLEIAQLRSGRSASGRWVEGSALSLPFPSGRFDAVLSAFLLRNLPDLGAGFREMRRMLAPSGSLLALEITEPTAPFVRATFHAYFDHVVPALGVAVGSAGPYRYLPESLRHLPSRDAMVALLEASGFVHVVAEPLSQGIVTAYFAEVPVGTSRP
jgi:demethylmenaquinone methyltransferase/2-methoxy-6-polyprenyl-1,4-benzoquinol methylase